MSVSSNPFSEAEVQKFKEISAKAKFHSDEHQRLSLDLRPYRDWCSLGQAASIYSAEELQALEELSIQAKHHFEEMQACQMQMKPYRDLKNVIDYARQEGYRQGYERAYGKGYLAGVALKCLQENLPIEFIAKATGLSEVKVEALQN